MLLLVALQTARAHVPHDTVLALAATDGGPWFLIVDPQGLQLWLRSDDAGATWNMVGGEPTRDNLRGAARLDDGTLVILGDSSVWWSADEGETWLSGPLPGDVDELRLDETLLLTGPGGAWQGRPDTGWAAITTSPVIQAGPHAVSLEDSAVLIDDGAWSLVESPRHPTAVAYDGATTWVGSGDGSVLAWDGVDWAVCGALPDEAEEHNDVVEISTLGGKLAVLTGHGGPYLSEDGCATWLDRSVPVVVDYGTGGPASEEDSQDILQQVGETWAVGGWAGLFLSPDAGASWSAPTLVPSDYARGIAFSSDWDASPTMFVAAYSAAIQYTSDGGASWQAPNHGMGVTNAQRVLTRPDDPSTIYAVVNHLPWRSTDRGGSWEMILPKTISVEEILFWTDPAHLWVTGDEVSESFDGGETWAARDDLTETFGAARVGGLVLLGDRACVTLAEPSGLACSPDEGATWDYVEKGEDGRVSQPVGWPPDSPEQVIWGDASGIYRSALDGTEESWRQTEPIESVAVAPDGSLFAATRSSQLLRSDDGGEGWAEFGERLPAHIHALEVRPDWRYHPQLVVGTHDGVYLVDDDGNAEHVDYERLDNTSPYFECTGCPDQVDDETSDMDSIQPLATGAVLRASVRGSAIRVLGNSGVGGVADLTIDGVGYGVFGSGEQTGALVEVSGLAEGWHEVVISGMPDVVVDFDVLEAWGDGARLDFSFPDPLIEIEGTAEAAPDDTGAAAPGRSRGRDVPRRGSDGCPDGSAAGLLMGVGGLLRRRLLRGGKADACD